MVIKVQRGDTIVSIANRYHTTVQAIIDVNDLQSREVHVGARLLVNGYLTHVWMPSDTLEEVAKRYCVTKQAIEVADGEMAIGHPIIIPV